MIRFGLIGAGNIARKFAHDIQAVPNATLVAVASRSQEKAEAFQQLFDIDFAFDSYEEMVQFQGIDAVYVATPHCFHKEHSTLSMTNGKHVLCEKPLAVNYKDAQEMYHIAKTNGVLLMEAMWTRFLPALDYLRQRLQDDELGLLESIDISFGFDMGSRLSPTGRMLNPNLAGGGLLDLGVYFVSMFTFVTNDPIRDYDVTPVFAETGVDLHLTVTGTLENSQNTSFRLECAVEESLSNKAVLQYKNGTIVVPNFWSATAVIDNGKELSFPHKSGGFEYEIEHFSNSIVNGYPEDPIMTAEETLKVMRFMDDIRERIGLKFPFEQ